ncbi:hypothetical protein MTO96_046043 [Rhipicephalus appendiculatus]
MAREALGEDFPMESMCHWKLALRFRKNYFLLVDFTIDSKERIRLGGTNTWTSKPRLEELKESIVKVCNELAEMSDMGSYDILDRSYQVALNQLMDSLHLQVPRNLKTLKESISQAGGPSLRPRRTALTTRLAASRHAGCLFVVSQGSRAVTQADPPSMPSPSTPFCLRVLGCGRKDVVDIFAHLPS